MKKTIAGNWKMNGTLATARDLVADLRKRTDALLAAATDVEVIVFPSATLLFPMAKALAGSTIRLGAQNAHFAAQGAFTGEVSVAQVKDTGCTHLLVGHSERRHVFGESNELLTRKLRAGLEAGLNVVYCVGETLDQRQKGQTGEVIDRQLREGLDRGLAWERILVAYEPVWAIGTGQNATPQQAQEVHARIRKWLRDQFPGQAPKTPLLYGGSVKADNAAGLLSQPDVDGLLVGGASLVAGDFAAIIAAGREAAHG